MPGERITALARLNKPNSSISVKNIASQKWCEKQMELYMKVPYSTPAMQSGAAVHTTMQEKVYVKLVAEPVTWQDRQYKWAYENYAGLSKMSDDRYCREIRIYGSIDGFKISGQIDELLLSDGKVMIAEDKTILGEPGKVSLRFESDKVQSFIYKRLVDDIREGRYTYATFAKQHDILGRSLSPAFKKAINELGVKPELQTLEGIYTKLFEKLVSLPETSDKIELRYLDRDSKELLTDLYLPFESKQLEEYLNDAMKYWHGEREAQPVPEKEQWKCKMCKFFGKECKVWWTEPQKSL